MRRLIVKSVLIIMALSLLISGCTSSKQTIKDNFYSYQQMTAEISTLASRYPQILSVHEIAKTYEGRSIIILEIGNKTGKANKSGLMATFAQHSGEHATTKTGMGFVKLLLNNYGIDADITKLLDEKTVYIAPMVNPDGVDYDLNSDEPPFNWRKNRKPVGSNIYGVDLNRNWGYHWDAPTTDAFAKSMNTPDDQYYHGDHPFSETETKMLSAFISNHKNIKLFVDYHTGTSTFMQGDILIPFSYTEDQEFNQQELAKYEFISNKLCELINDPNDKRAPYAAMRTYKIKEFVFKQTPLLQKPFVWLSLPSSTLAPGAAIDWAASQGMIALGIEMACDDNFISNMPASQENLIKNQFKGFLFLIAQSP